MSSVWFWVVLGGAVTFLLLAALAVIGKANRQWEKQAHPDGEPDEPEQPPLPGMPR